MKHTRHTCDIEALSDGQFALLPGPRPGTALRVCLQSPEQPGVRLEQLGHDAVLGWYVQKTFYLPREVLAALATELRKANCLMPSGSHATESQGVLRIAPEAA